MSRVQTLADDLDVTERNLSSHLQRMEDADVVDINKEFVDKRPRTTAELTDHGRSLFEDHVQTLQSLIDGLEWGRAESRVADRRRVLRATPPQSPHWWVGTSPISRSDPRRCSAHTSIRRGIRYEPQGARPGTVAVTSSNDDPSRCGGSL